MLDKDQLYMRRCLELAKKGLGNVAPNPMVGAVLVHYDRIISEGYHQKFGEPHAEVNCINNLKSENKHLIKKSTLYVSLEPCSHFGKTPPCADLIIKYKIPKVVIGCQDVYKNVDGKGIKKLEGAGIEVTISVLDQECKDLNKRFFTFHEKQRPYIILKWAESSDKKIGLPDKKVLISNEYTNRLVHKWRSEEAAILIGTNTALTDNPSLTTRLWNGKNPIRLVIDKDLRLPPHLHIFNKEVRTIVFNSVKNEEDFNLTFYKINDENMLPEIVKALYDYEIQSVIVEGGAKLLQSFIDEGLWDECRIIKNEKLIINNGIDSPKLKNGILYNRDNYFDDTISYFQHSL